MAIRGLFQKLGYYISPKSQRLSSLKGPQVNTIFNLNTLNLLENTGAVSKTDLLPPVRSPTSPLAIRLQRRIV